MLKLYRIRITAILLLLSLIIVGCSDANAINGPLPQTTVTPKNSPTPVPTPTFPIPVYTPFVATPTPTAAPSCAFWIFDCDETPTPTPCNSHYVYDSLVNEGQSWIVVSQQQDQNNSASPAQVTFTSTTSKTVTVTDELGLTLTLSAQVGADFIDAIKVSVQLHINHSVSKSVTTTIGNSYNFTIPPGKLAIANYGVKVQITNGHLYDQAGCEGNASDLGTDITYVPIAAGWCVWTSDESPCPSI